jgi:peptide-methionine (S)-S-oxide reductase
MTTMTAKTYLAAALAAGLLFTGIGIYAMSNTSPRETSPAPKLEPYPAAAPAEARLAKTTFGGGCFWCTEAFFLRLQGVESVISGYSGGHVKNPTYREVCNGETGHAEVIQITYNPQLVSFDELLEVFWKTHDPTTLNRQGNDYGPQYRSVVFYHDEEQRKIAEEYKEKLDASGAFRAPIVTEISPFTEFYAAEDYHQQYFDLNPDQMYCRMVIGPKLEKFRKVFKDKLKEGEE